MKHTLKRLVGEIFEIRYERRRVGSVRLIKNTDSPNDGKYVAILNSMSEHVYADTAEAALAAILAVRVERTEEKVREAEKLRRQVLMRSQTHNPRPTPHQNESLGIIRSVRIPPRRKEDRKNEQH